MSLEKVENKDFTEEEYQKMIPKHCLYQTVDEHREQMMYCWGISYGFITADTEKEYCKDCEFCKEATNYGQLIDRINIK